MQVCSHRYEGERESIYNLIPKIQERPPKPTMWVTVFQFSTWLYIDFHRWHVSPSFNDYLYFYSVPKTNIFKRFVPTGIAPISPPMCDKRSRRTSRALKRWWVINLSFCFELRLLLWNKQIWQKNVNRAQYFFALLRIKFLSFRGHRKLRLRGRKTFWRSIRRNQGYQKVSIHRSLSTQANLW